jgi:glycosyl transferase, family 25
VQVFVINLARSVDRLSFMTDQLGPNFERIEAVDGKALPDALADQFANPGDLGAGEIGCYASHLLAAGQIVARSLPYAIILEDDVELDPDFLETVEISVRLLPQWDVISLSGAKQRPHVRLAEVGNRHLVRFLRFPKTTAAYVLSNAGSRKLLAPRPRFRPVDVDIHYGWEMELDGYGIFPPPAKQTGRFLSSIPKCPQRFYWRADPIGYVLGRIKFFRKLGTLGLIRALTER